MSKICCHLQYLQTRCRDSGDNMLQNLLKYAVIYKQKNAQKNSKHHDHSLTFCITVRIIFFHNFQRLSRGRCWSTFAYVYSSLLLLKQWIPWIRGLITGLGDCQEYSSSIWSGVEWLPPQFHLTKQLKAFVSALQVYHKSGRFSLVQFSSTAQREKPTIS